MSLALAVVCLIATRSTTDSEDVIVGEWLTDNVESCPIAYVIGDRDLKWRCTGTEAECRVCFPRFV